MKQIIVDHNEVFKFYKMSFLSVHPMRMVSSE